ncbi:BspA family leucine-rich repeat surface protein [Bifidobacterium sp. ESL0728]|uniref:BspA family leucine-rich repeat surface protein n=1 Tax=Bifidobacterium sp. ESL0728 TaxID=2983220 RepID=UPI0023F980F6|nr:BspA family leucine-rich repeat surface protein [Bifidobacterium sp. ESL0728]WEV58927.1 BspA family leucine-rich repeat surface protein [Bifidobacterium sp. ESL0728]
MSRKSTKLIGVLAAAAMMLSTAVTALAQPTDGNSADNEQTNSQSMDAAQGQGGQQPGGDDSSNNAQQQSGENPSQSNDKKGDVDSADQSGSANAEAKKDAAPAAQANGPVQRQQPTVGQQPVVGPQATCPGGTWGTAAYTCEINADSTYTLHVGTGTLAANTHKSGDWYLMSDVLTNVSKVVFDDPSNTHLPANSAGLFGYDKYNGWGLSQNLLTEIVGIGDVDTSQVTDMTSMFRGATHLTSLDLHKWNVSHVRFMYYMFDRDSQLTTVGDIGNWDVSQVGNMEGMFQYDSSLKSLDLSNWQTKKLYDMNYLFSFAKSLTSVGDLSGWNVSNVKDMYNVFSYMDSLEALDLQGWDVSNVGSIPGRGMDYLFTNDFALKSVDVRGWNPSRVTTMKCMFSGDSYLTTIRGIGDWNVSQLTAADDMFEGAGGKVQEEPAWATEIAKWHISALTSAPGMFEGTSLTKLDLSSWNTRSLTDGSDMFDSPQKYPHNDADRTEGIRDFILGPDTVIKADFLRSYQTTGQPPSDPELGYSGQWMLTRGAPGTARWLVDRTSADASGQLAARTQGSQPFAGEYQWERSYTLRYDTGSLPSGSVSGMPDPAESVYYGKTGTKEVVLDFPMGAPTAEQYEFTGWKADDGTVYQAGAPGVDLTLKAGVNHLTAQWQRKQVQVQYKLTLEKNGKPGAVIDADTITLSSTTTDTSHTFTLGNDDVYTDTSGLHEFTGWSTVQDSYTDTTGTTYKVGDHVTLNSSNPTLTLYAQWNTHYKLFMKGHVPEADADITFEQNPLYNPWCFDHASSVIRWPLSAGLERIFTLHDDTGADVTSDFEFTGWSLDKEGNHKITEPFLWAYETDPNTTIYAQWKRVHAKKYIYSLQFNNNLSGGTLAKTFPTVTSGPNKLADTSYTLTIPSEYTVVHDDSNSYRFLGWLDPETTRTYQAGDTVNLTSDRTSVTLYGRWKAVEHQVVPILGPAIPTQPSPVGPLPPSGPLQPAGPSQPGPNKPKPSGPKEPAGPAEPAQPGPTEPKPSEPKEPAGPTEPAGTEPAESAQPEEPTEHARPGEPAGPTHSADSAKPKAPKAPAKSEAPAKGQTVTADSNAKQTPSVVPVTAPVPVPVFRANAPTIVTVPRVASRAAAPQAAAPQSTAPVAPQQRNQAAPRHHDPCVSGDKRANTAAFIMQASGNVYLAGNDVCGSEEASAAPAALTRSAFPWWIFLVLALVLAAVVYVRREKTIFAQHRSEECNR